MASPHGITSLLGLVVIDIVVVEMSLIRQVNLRDHVFEWLFDSMSRRLSLLSHHFAMLYIHWSSGLVQV